MAKDWAAGIELGRSFHQEGKFNVKVCESESLFVMNNKATFTSRTQASRGT